MFLTGACNSMHARVLGLYKGCTAHYLRLGPHTILTFMLWEQIKAFADEKGF